MTARKFMPTMQCDLCSSIMEGLSEIFNRTLGIHEQQKVNVFALINLTIEMFGGLSASNRRVPPTEHGSHPTIHGRNSSYSIGRPPHSPPPSQQTTQAHRWKHFVPPLHCKFIWAVLCLLLLQEMGQLQKTHLQLPSTLNLLISTKLFLKF